MATWLDPALMRGRKAKELSVWLAAVRDLDAARSVGARADPARLSAHIADFVAARRYEPPASLPRSGSPRRDTRSDDIAAIRRWAATESGTLSCESYATYRRTVDPGLPHRNTLTRRFGSWQAALEAADLAERAASTAEVRRAQAAGGAAGRKAHDEAQRERVLATLRYGITIHGSLPTAMQFFRWRLVGAPATPTQATVYRLFPGGWPAVMEALKESSPGLMSTIPH